jgi:hypothetical protein
MNLFNLDDILLKIVEKFERAGGLTGLLYGGLFVIAAYLISKFGDTDGLTGLIFAGLILLTAYLIRHQIEMNQQLFEMVQRSDERLIDLKKTLYKANKLPLPDRRKRRLSIVPDENRRDE